MLHGNSTLFQNFPDLCTILNKKEYKGVPLPDVAVSTIITRQSENMTDTAAFLISHLEQYSKYLKELLSNLKSRFECQTFEICVSIGKLFNFDSVYDPSYDNLVLIMNPMKIESKEEFYEILQDLPFLNQINTIALFPQFVELKEFAIRTLTQFVESKSDDALPSSRYILKQFVNNDRNDNHCAELVRLISFCVCFPVSEAIVESWGSTITHLYNIKHNPSEPTDDLSETGTIDKLTFIKLCGPPPGRKDNKKLFKRALIEHFDTSEFERHFTNSSSHTFNRVTSKVVKRIVDSETSEILPCFI